MPPKKPVGNRGKPQVSDPDAHPRVAETSALPPPPGASPPAMSPPKTSAPPPPPVASPPSEPPPRKSMIVRIPLPPHLRRPKGSGVLAQPRRAETLAPRPSDVPTSSGARPPSDVFAQPRTSILSSPELGRSRRPARDPKSSGVPIMCKEVGGDTSDASKPEELNWKDSDLMLAKGCVEMNDHQVTRLPSTTATQKGQAQDPKSSGGPPGVPIMCKEVRGDKGDASKPEELDWKDSDWMLAKGCVEMNDQQVTRHPSISFTLKRVALVSHQDMLLHEPPDVHPENPERLTRIMSKLKKDKLFDR
ncbi:unnamed protein product [Urochloa humidicola]